jgi:hypothetical protein
MSTLFVLMVSDEWPIIMEGCSAATSDAARIFFVLFWSINEVLILNVLVRYAYTSCLRTAVRAEYDIASLHMISFYCFVTKACVRRPGTAASVERRRREPRTLLAGAVGELAGATRLRQRQSFERVHILWLARPYHPRFAFYFMADCILC